MAKGFTYDDGGRVAAGFKGDAGDCVCRAIAIASGRPYREVYERLAAGAGGFTTLNAASMATGRFPTNGS